MKSSASSNLHLTVSELYEAVWQTPLKALAEQWHIHAHALGQLLDKQGIPRPPSGYWTQKSVGKVVKVTPLPGSLSPKRLVDLTVLQASKREKSRSLPSPLPEPKKTLGRYPLLKGIKGSLNKPHFQYDFILTQQYDDNSVLRLDVSETQRDRAINILHRLMSALEQRNWPVKVEKHRYAKRLANVVTIYDEEIAFRLRERLKQHKRELTKKDQEDKARWGYISHEKINMPSGSLQLYIEGPLPSGVKSMFEDKASLSLENQLGNFIEHLELSAEHSKVVRAERQAWAKEWKDKERRRAEYERAIKSEETKIQTFLSMFNHWKQAQECRQFINEVVNSEDISNIDGDALKHWREWSESVADAIDPLKSKVLTEFIDGYSPVEQRVFENAIKRVIKDAPT